jgi:hypothetical protein
MRHRDLKIEKSFRLKPEDAAWLTRVAEAEERAEYDGSLATNLSAAVAAIDLNGFVFELKHYAGYPENSAMLDFTNPATSERCA